MTEKRSGIYRIANGGKYYVGSAINIQRRFAQHISALRSSRHHSIKLQRAWDKYGEAEFVFEVIEDVADRAMLLEREQHWIDELNACDGGYNIAPIAGRCTGIKLSPEACLAISKRLTGRLVSEETREKLRISKIGFKHSPETCAKISAIKRETPISDLMRQRALEANTGRKQRPESIEKIAASKRGKKMPDHVRTALLLATTGVKQSAETIAKRVAKLKGKKRPLDAIERTAAARRGVPMSEEQKAKISMKLKGRPRPRELVEKTAAALRGRKCPPHVVRAMQAGRRPPKTEPLHQDH